MCLISSGSKSEATSFLSLSVSFHVVSACLFLFVGILQKYRKYIKMCFISVPHKEEHRILGEKIQMHFKNVCNFKPCLIILKTTCG